MVLATKEQNVKTRGAAYDLLLALAAAAEKSAPGGSEAAKARAQAAYRSLILRALCAKQVKGLRCRSGKTGSGPR